MVLRIFLLLFCFLSCIASADEAVIDGVRKNPLYIPYYAGTCIENKQTVYLNEAFFIKNKVIKIRSENGYSIIKIVRDLLDVKKFDKNGSLIESYILDVKGNVLKRNDKVKDIDIKISFVWVDNELGVYWKESFLHKQYMQGVYMIKNNQLNFYCQGSGGGFSSD